MFTFVHFDAQLKQRTELRSVHLNIKLKSTRARKSMGRGLTTGLTLVPKIYTSPAARFVLITFPQVTASFSSAPAGLSDGFTLPEGGFLLFTSKVLAVSYSQQFGVQSN